MILREFFLVFLHRKSDTIKNALPECGPAGHFAVPILGTDFALVLCGLLHYILDCCSPYRTKVGKRGVVTGDDTPGHWPGRPSV